jgi:hypothetical protein
MITSILKPLSNNEKNYIAKQKSPGIRGFFVVSISLISDQRGRRYREHDHEPTRLRWLHEPE